jgi:hypothetical protein
MAVFKTLGGPAAGTIALAQARCNVTPEGCLPMAEPSRRNRSFSGCHPEVSPTPSSPGALHGWQPPDPSAAVRHYLLLHHYLRLRRLQQQAHRTTSGRRAAAPGEGAE